MGDIIDILKKAMEDGIPTPEVEKTATTIPEDIEQLACDLEKLAEQDLSAQAEVKPEAEEAVEETQEEVEKTAAADVMKAVMIEKIFENEDLVKKLIESKKE